ncbi:MAG: hypothetical protein WBC60_14675 [Cognaticolwellia sp.]
MLKLALIGFYIVFFVFSNDSFSAENSITFETPIMNSTSSDGSFFLLLPIPNQRVALNSEFFLRANKKSIEAIYRIINIWPTLKNEKFIRVLSIEVNAKHILSESIPSQQLTLSWELSDNVSSFRGGNAVGSIKSHLVYPSKSWLVQSILLHQNNAIDNDWYIEPQKKYANYVTNQALLTEKNYPPQKSSQWLYDRPQAIYQLFLMTEESAWLDSANELADFYIGNIDDSGMFVLKKNFDPKLMMPKGVLYRYLLSGDLEAKQTLHRIFERSFDWDESYNLRRGFWTERNQAAALNVAVSYWELTSDAKALKRINDIIDATVKMTFYPENDWPLRGCPQHSFKSHEGWGDDSPACSPWMMALLADSLWRFYQLTEDKRAASLIDAFGDFVLNHGIYYGDKRVKNIVIPKYIVSMDKPKQEELNQWTDPQHACDVAALLGKSVYIKKKTNQDDFLVKTLFSALLEQCTGSYTKWQQEQKKKQTKDYWEIRPPRRFGWMYSTTSDLPWLKSQLLKDN